MSRRRPHRRQLVTTSAGTTIQCSCRWRSSLLNPEPAAKQWTSHLADCVTAEVDRLGAARAKRQQSEQVPIERVEGWRLSRSLKGRLTTGGAVKELRRLGGYYACASDEQHRAGRLVFSMTNDARATAYYHAAEMLEEGRKWRRS